MKNRTYSEPNVVGKQFTVMVTMRGRAWLNEGDFSSAAYVGSPYQVNGALPIYREAVAKGLLISVHVVRGNRMINWG